MDEHPDERHRTSTNLILLLIFAALVGAGIWLVMSLDAARKADDCISAGRRNCNPIDAPR
jgi:hypothetical protein